MPRQRLQLSVGGAPAPSTAFSTQWCLVVNENCFNFLNEHFKKQERRQEGQKRAGLACLSFHVQGPTSPQTSHIQPFIYFTHRISYSLTRHIDQHWTKQTDWTPALSTNLPGWRMPMSLPGSTDPQHCKKVNSKVLQEKLTLLTAFLFTSCIYHVFPISSTCSHRLLKWNNAR